MANIDEMFFIDAPANNIALQLLFEPVHRALIHGILSNHIQVRNSNDNQCIFSYTH